MSTEHLDLDALADLLAGEGTPEQVAHAGRCSRCSAALSDLDMALVPVAAELAALAATPVPAPPPGLEDRLRAAIAAERQQSATGVGPARPAAAVARGPEAAPDTEAAPDPEAPGRGAAPGRGLVVPLPRRGRRSPLLGAAAAAVGVLVVGAVGLGVLRGQGPDSAQPGSDSDTTALGAPALAQIPASSSGTDYRRSSRSLAAALPRLLDAPARPREQQEAAEPSDQVAPRAVASTAGDDPLARLRDPVELAGCLDGLAARPAGGPGDRQPLALDYASLEGRPALLVVLPSARPGSVDVFAVGAGCRSGDDQTLFFASVDRPA